MEKNFSPGFLTFVKDELGFSEEELERELTIWRSYTSRLTAPFFDGFLPLLRRFKEAGGIITVVSHSEKPSIERDYRYAGAPDLPQLIFGWQGDPEKQKPHPFPVNQILATLGFDKKDALILDDLYPAVAMGKAAGVDVAGAGWGHDIPMIREAMVRETVQYFTTIEEFERWLFMEETL